MSWTRYLSPRIWWEWVAGAPQDKQVPNERLLTEEALRGRRVALARSGIDTTKLPASGSLGLALSGGGIRSATISLGAVQALARHDRLVDFDYMSTVSGGGYLGSFLGTLFLPPSARGMQASEAAMPTDDELRMAREFGQAALALGAQEVRTPSVGATAGNPPGVRSPVRWLRENGRYLAPNGATDYAMAATYIVRNWLAMLYVFALPIGAAFLILTVVLMALMPKLMELPIPDPLGLVRLKWSYSCDGVVDFLAKAKISPILLLTPIAGFLALAAGAAYWLTEWVPSSGRWVWLQRLLPNLGSRVAFLTGCSATGATIGALGVVIWARFPRGCATPDPKDVLAAFAVALAAAATTMALMAFVRAAWGTGTAFPAEMRRVLTSLATSFNQMLLILLAVGAIDSLALLLLANFKTLVQSHGGLGLQGAAGLLLPAAAWLIGQISKLSGRGGGAGRFLEKNIWSLAFVAGTLLYGALAVITDTIVQLVVWSGDAWPADLERDGADWRAIQLYGPILLGLTLGTGGATRFINLSSLHNYYFSRLTRAYLGASNQSRLSEVAKGLGPSPVTENHSGDDLPIAHYQRIRSVAPLHLINVTLNETRNREGSQLVDRDRKGVPMVFAPEGVFIDAPDKSRRGEQALFPWTTLREQQVESLTLGQLCAISGAAASSGMGARTTLGGALAMTFANLRLGYWWSVGDMVRNTLPARHTLLSVTLRKATRLLRTYFYLGNEMTARYSQDYGRLYLSDGGHFENSATYELLRRGVRTIVVLDNGADPAFCFEDLENLIRKARLDLGREIRVSSPVEVVHLFGTEGATMFLNGQAPDWITAAATTGGRGFILLLKVYDVTLPASTAGAPGRWVGHILWVKPRLVSSLPQDVRGYGQSHPTFPNETTADQFFDEAQWESYRVLGLEAIHALLTSTPAGSNVLRTLGVLPDRVDDEFLGAAFGLT